MLIAGPQVLTYPTLLPDSPAPRLRGYTRESVVAEKIEAMVALGEVNTRYKDFYDVWFLARTADFEGVLLARAIAATFARRGTRLTATPVAWTDAFALDAARQAQWQAFARRTGLADAPGTLAAAVAAIRAFLGPWSPRCWRARRRHGPGTLPARCAVARRASDISPPVLAADAGRIRAPDSAVWPPASPQGVRGPRPTDSSLGRPRRATGPGGPFRIRSEAGRSRRGDPGPTTHNQRAVAAERQRERGTWLAQALVTG